MDRDTEKLKGYLSESSYTVAVTGSGISYLYGVGRLKRTAGRGGAMNSLSESYARSDPEGFYAVMRDCFLDATFKLGPSPAHVALAEMERRGLLQGIVTQNLDCLHERAGSRNIAEFQGSFDDNACTGCGARVRGYERWDEGKCPRCPSCGAPLMPASFCRSLKTAESDRAERMDRAAEMIGRADLVLVMGTTGFGSESYMKKFRKGARLAQINPSPTVFDEAADLNISADAGEVLNEILREA